VLWRRDTLGKGVVMRRGDDPSSLCTLRAAIAISMVRFVALRKIFDTDLREILAEMLVMKSVSRQ